MVLGALGHHRTTRQTQSLSVRVVTGLGQLSQVVFNKTAIVDSNANSLLTQSLRIFAEPHTGWWQEMTNPTCGGLIEVTLIYCPGSNKSESSSPTLEKNLSRGTPPKGQPQLPADQVNVERTS